MRHVQDSTRRHFPRTVRPGSRATAPSPEELRTLFVEQRIPVPEIAARWGVSHKVIYSRIQEYGLRPDWDADTLRRLYIDEGVSCEEIAVRYGKSPSRIYQLLDQHGIPRIRRSRKVDDRIPDAEEFRRLYVDEALTLPELACHYGHTIDQIWAAVNHFNLHKLRQQVAPPKRMFPPRGRYTAKDGHKVRSGLELVVDDWLFAHGLPHSYEARIAKSPYRTDFIVGNTYIEVWGMIGKKLYDTRRKAKLALYAELGVPLVSVVPSDFPHLAPLHVLLTH